MTGGVTEGRSATDLPVAGKTIFVREYAAAGTWPAEHEGGLGSARPTAYTESTRRRTVGCRGGTIPLPERKGPGVGRKQGTDEGDNGRSRSSQSG